MSNYGSYSNSGNVDKSIKLWVVKSKKEICTMPSLEYGPINDISFLNIGKIFIFVAGHV